MASFNRVILLGNITRDIELRYIPNGTAVADITLAVNDRRKSQSGEWVEETSFIDVTLWARTAEIASEYLGKGSPILVEGRLKQDTWETDGQKRSRIRVVCQQMQMLGAVMGRGGSGGGGSNNYRPQHDESEYSRPSNEYEDQGSGRSAAESTPEGDIPF